MNIFKDFALWKPIFELKETVEMEIGEKWKAQEKKEQDQQHVYIFLSTLPFSISFYSSSPGDFTR